MEQCLNVMFFVNNIVFNQACPSCKMCDKINEASKETNEDNAASTISRQPAKKPSASNRQTSEKKATNGRKMKSKRILLKPLLNNWRRKLMNKLRKTKSPAARGLQQRSMCSQKRAREAELGREERMTQRTDKRSKSGRNGSTEGKLEIIGKVKKIQ